MAGLHEEAEGLESARAKFCQRPAADLQIPSGICCAQGLFRVKLQLRPRTNILVVRKLIWLGSHLEVLPQNKFKNAHASGVGLNGHKGTAGARLELDFQRPLRNCLPTSLKIPSASGLLEVCGTLAQGYSTCHFHRNFHQGHVSCKLHPKRFHQTHLDH